MEGIRTTARSVLKALTLASVLATAIPVALACDTRNAPDSTHAQKTSESRTAGEGKQPENRNTPVRCKRGEKSSNGKTCPAEGGGERVPQDNKRSPLDDVPPLAPLVA